MAKTDEPYQYLEIESYEIASTAGKRGKIHFRPVPGQGANTKLDVECTRSLRKYPVGTRFKIMTKLTDREGGGEFYYSHHSWKADVLSIPESK